MELFKLLGTIAVDNVEANKSIDDTTEKAENSENKMSSAFKKIGTAIITFLAVDKIKEFGLACINASADANAASSQFSQVFGKVEKTASKNLNKIAKDTGIVTNRMKGSYTQIAAFAKTTGMETKDALGLADRAMVAVADSAAFYDRTLEDTTESLQSFLKGNFENDAALGLSCTETTRNAAANKLYGKTFQELSESQKQLTLLQMVEDANKASGALGQAARESNTWTNQVGNLKQAWTDLCANLGAPILDTATTLVGKVATKVSELTEKFKNGKNPVEALIEKIKSFKNWCADMGDYISITFKPALDDLKTAFTKIKDAVQPIIEKFTDYVNSGELAKDATELLKDSIKKVEEAVKFVVEKLTTFSDWCSEHTTLIETLVIIIGSFAAAFALVTGAVTLWNTVSAIATTVTTGFGAAIAFLTSPVTLVILAIGTLIAVGVLLYKNWDEIKEIAISAFGKVKETVKGAIDTVKKKIQSVIDFVKNDWKELLTLLVNPFAGAFALLYKHNDKFREAIDNLKEKVVGAFDKIKNTLGGLVDTAKTKIETFATNLIDGIKDLPDKFKEKGKDIVKGLWNGINNMKDWVVNKIKGFGDDVLGGIKDFFGIHSPSTVMRDQVGKYLAEGVAVGFNEEDDAVVKKIGTSMNKWVNTASDMTESFAGSNSNRTHMQNTVNIDTSDVKQAIESLQNNMYDIIVQALTDGVRLSVDNREIARVVKNHV